MILPKLISKKLSRKKGKINTIQHGQGEKHRQRIFSPSTPPAKVEQLIAWPRREKMKIQVGKNKDTGGKIKTEGEKISYIFPQLKYSAQILSQKKIVFSGKNMISILQYFPPSTQSVRVEQLLHGLRGKK